MDEGRLSLLRAARAGDDAAMDAMVRENAGLIWAVARRYFGRGVEPDDLYQLGSLGFLKAVRDFDEDYGTQFSTYAVPKIAGEIRRFLRDDAPVKAERSVRERALAVCAARDALRDTLGHEPTLSELSEATGQPPEEIAELELAIAPPQSLSQELGDGLTLEQTLADPASDQDERIALRAAIDALPERERMTILLRYFKGLTQERAARVLGVSQVQVSRLERKALERLREALS